MNVAHAIAALASEEMKRLEQLFDAYSRNLGIHMPKFGGLFICPLCLRGFNKVALRDRSVTEEHVVPSSLSGRIVTLTCAECNNKHGSGLDAHIHTKMRMKDVFQGLRSHTAAITVDGARMAASITMPQYTEGKTPTLTIEGLPDKSAPRHTDHVEKALLAGTRQVTLTYTFKLSIPKSQSALLRMAYLMMFHYFGYFYPRLKVARQLREIIEHPVDRSPFYRGIQELPSPPPRPNCIGILTDPRDAGAFVCFLKLKSDAERHFAVLLPGLDQEDPLELYENLKRIKKTSLSFSIVEYSRDYLTKREYWDLPLRLWRQVRTSTLTGPG